MSGTDITGAFERLNALVGAQDPNEMIGFVHAGSPQSKHRARWSPRSKGWYTPEATRTAEAIFAQRWRQAMGDRPTFTDTLALVAVFYRPNRQRIDVDNLIKLVLDAGTKAKVWRDDSQIAALAGIIELDTEKPRTIVALCPYLSTLSRQPLLLNCAQCGNEFERPEWYQRRHRLGKFCSPACRSAAQIPPRPCATCGREFKPHTRTQPGRFCSVRCARIDKRKPVRLCATCGKQVSDRRKNRCRSCYLAYKRAAERSAVGAAIEVLREAGCPLSIWTLVSRINDRAKIQTNKNSLEATLTAYINRGRTFCRPAPTTYALSQQRYAGLGESPRAVVTIEPLSAAERL